MEVTVYGLLGYAGRVNLPVEELDVEDLEPGQEFAYNGYIYEIRSVFEHGQGIGINVVMAQAMAIS
jgi:hypothetical protein